jgi:hypothetical protein
VDVVTLQVPALCTPERLAGGKIEPRYVGELGLLSSALKVKLPGTCLGGYYLGSSFCATGSYNEYAG